MKKSSTNLLLIKSNFIQLFGFFSGYIRDESGNKIQIQRIFGTSEEHTAKW
ncbi:DUF2804 domain-containing protein [Fervidicella metallireducens]|uniref:DUF2804 family protein n=1 Tax=Fervidicella metallireducens TaxID=655338 RepID=UPI000A013717